jgi:hypothetical protein
MLLSTMLFQLMIRTYGIKKEFRLQMPKINCRGLIHQAHLFINLWIDTHCLEAGFISCRGLIYQMPCYKLSIRKDEEEAIW